MRPKAIRFTGHTVPFENKIIDGRENKVVPPDWVRVPVELENLPPFSFGVPLQFREWMDGNMEGQWDAYRPQPGTKTIIVRFEHDYDAAMFRLKEGPKAWAETDQ